MTRYNPSTIIEQLSSSSAIGADWLSSPIVFFGWAPIGFSLSDSSSRLFLGQQGCQGDRFSKMELGFQMCIYRVDGALVTSNPVTSHDPNLKSCQHSYCAGQLPLKLLKWFFLHDRWFPRSWASFHVIAYFLRLSALTIVYFPQRVHFSTIISFYDRKPPVTWF